MQNSINFFSLRISQSGHLSVRCRRNGQRSRRWIRRYSASWWCGPRQSRGLQTRRRRSGRGWRSRCTSLWPRGKNVGWWCLLPLCATRFWFVWSEAIIYLHWQCFCHPFNCIRYLLRFGLFVGWQRFLAASIQPAMMSNPHRGFDFGILGMVRIISQNAMCCQMNAI